MRRTGILIALTLTMSLGSLTAQANQTPRSLATDFRVKLVAYDPDNIVTLYGTHLISTGIQFDKSEKVLSIDMGDQVAWDINKESLKVVPYILFIKPKLPESNTNMVVITNKRTYRFRLITRPGDTPNSKNVTYSLAFKYPEQDMANLASELNNLSGEVLGDGGNPVNRNYTFVGSKALAPIRAIDNGTYTLFEFRKNTVMPAIFGVDRQQNETLLNYRVSGDKVFIPGVRHQYTLRNGDEVTTVYNESFTTR